MLRAEIARSLHAIDFKPIIATVGRDQPEVVQKRGLFIGHRPAEASDGKTAENVGSKTMRAEKLGRTGFQKVHRSIAQRGIRNSNSGHGFQTCQAHSRNPFNKRIQAASKRSAFITLVQAAAKSLTNFFSESAQA